MRNPDFLFRRRRFAVLAVLPLACLASMPRSAAAGGLPVHDSANLFALEVQIIHAVTQIEHLINQIDNQVSMLAALPLNTTEEVNLAMAWVHRALVISRRINYVTFDLERRFQSFYPEDYSRISRNQLNVLRAQWAEKNRWAVLEAMRVQATAVEAMPTNQLRVARIMDASQIAEGQTAATQANTQLLATLSEQLQQLEALQISATRMEVSREAQRTALLDFYRQRRTDLHRDDTTTSQRVRVVDPFPHAR